MKVRIKFQKFGAMKFIGHLDVMRYFQKAFRRAGVDIRYTKGYSPHQVMSFAAPLGVGLTSDSEYVDIELLSSDSAQVMIDRINAVLTEGFRITGFHFLKEREADHKKVTAMALVSSADYLVSLKDGYAVNDIINTQEKFRRAFEEFRTQKEIIIDKKTKTNEKSVDIRPMITMAAFDRMDYEEKLNNTLNEVNAGLNSDLTDGLNENDLSVKPEPVSKESNLSDNSELVSKESNLSENSELASKENNMSDSLKSAVEIQGSLSMTESAADIYNNGIKIYLQLDTGSSINLKPELVMEAFCNYLNIEFQSFAWQVHRLEVYTREEGTNRLVPLDKLDR